MANAGLHGIEGRLVDQMDIDGVRVPALSFRMVTEALLAVQQVEHRRRAQAVDETPFDTRVGLDHRAQFGVLGPVDGKGGQTDGAFHRRHRCTEA